MTFRDHPTSGAETRRKRKFPLGTVAMVAGIVLVLFSVLIAYIGDHGVPSSPDAETPVKPQARQDLPRAP
ncbi:hypothetical protein [Hansschlegelia beijingensis]|uniref:Uncharacterized protein n=1 Tax=Hansschlegelia beijingensis TaxID=1133344 RepID=A0A7W6GEY7_9HYPH|nr:hypothetical protein [Hansschlegelia beijingensis]MBB3972725.1 hypothetical protein [Hansschlegelia beijingensis]